MKYESIYDISKTALSIMNTCITEAAKESDIEVYQHYADRVIVDAVIVAAFNNLNRSPLSRQYRAILAVTFGDRWKWFIRTWGPMFIRNHMSLESVRWDEELRKEKAK
nr:MAG TPA: hypothetical protein [Caudoviricetes sp.]